MLRSFPSVQSLLDITSEYCPDQFSLRLNEIWDFCVRKGHYPRSRFTDSKKEMTMNQFLHRLPKRKEFQNFLSKENLQLLNRIYSLRKKETTTERLTRLITAGKFPSQSSEEDPQDRKDANWISQNKSNWENSNDPKLLHLVNQLFKLKRKRKRKEPVQRKEKRKKRKCNCNI